MPAPHLPKYKFLDLPRPDWLPVSGPPGATSAAHKPDQTEQIRALHAAGKSLNAIQTEVFGYRGGAAYASVKAALGDTRG
jgi:hypothetical protein